MSAITLDWVPTRTETKTGISLKAAENYSRQKEFRLALDSYIVDYTAHQGRRAEEIGGTVGGRFIGGNLATFAGSLRDWRRALSATREVWLFSHEMRSDWRQPRRHR
jgi:hypothetical protein